MALTLATLNASHAAADARRSRRIREAEALIRTGNVMLRNAEADYAAEIATILDARAPLIEADRVAAAVEIGDWLTISEIAPLRPPGTSRDRRAIRQAIRRAAQRWPVETRVRGAEMIVPAEWLKERRLIGGTRTSRS